MFLHAIAHIFAKSYQNGMKQGLQDATCNPLGERLLFSDYRTWKISYKRTNTSI